ncbi:aldolase/citrate lyase family protein [Limnobacter humi]|uniref:Aldolase/citrate lyase family protein n=1 Tax=Limnobacter humi TaxID=1778671 RepID=A0ABT1WK94_9BURK|nr:aldolase/citrate lyase family protein [Limnobacter humi]MCQ8897247.1 aldolase/citrate lyase family protein [Limnobacter humi]
MGQKKPTLDLGHISTILYSEGRLPSHLPVCDHYAGKPKFFEKALNLQAELGACFDITLDLEDGAEVGQPQEMALWAARSLGEYQTRHGPTARRPGVRLHPVADPHFHMDIQTVLQETVPTPAFLMLPKPEKLADVQLALELIADQCNKASKPAPPLHVLIETHGALADVHAIAGLQAVESLSFGLMDFVSGHRGAIPKGALNSPGQFETPLVRRAKLEISAACHRHGKVPSHNVSRQIFQPEQAGSDAARAKKDFGYLRMWSIHPAQIVHIVSALLPTAAEVDEATLVLQEAEKANWGPIQMRGELHDRASYRYFFEVLRSRAQPWG